MAPSDGGGFVWTPGARRSVNVLVAMQAMHMCASQVVELASEDLLVTLVQKVFREKPELIAERDEKRRKLGESPDAEALEKVEADFDEQIKVKANSRAAYIMSTVQVVIALGDFVIGPILGAAAGQLTQPLSGGGPAGEPLAWVSVADLRQRKLAAACHLKRARHRAAVIVKQLSELPR